MMRSQVKQLELSLRLLFGNMMNALVTLVLVLFCVLWTLNAYPFQEKFRQMKANYSSNSLVSDIPQSFNNGLSSAHIGEEDSNILL